MSRTLVLTVFAVVLTTLAAIGDADASASAAAGASAPSARASRRRLRPPVLPQIRSCPRSRGLPAPHPPTLPRRRLALARTDRRHRRRTGSRRAAVAFRFARRLRQRSCLLGLLAIGGVFVFRMLTARRAPSAAIPYARAPAGYGPATAPARVEPVLLPAQPAAPSTPFAGTLPAGFRRRRVPARSEAPVPASAGSVGRRRPQGARRRHDAGDGGRDRARPRRTRPARHDDRNADRDRCARRRNARRDDRGRAALGERPLHRHRARGRRRRRRRSTRSGT